MDVAVSVDKSRICHDWLGFGSVPTPESVFASNVTPGTYSACSDATNTVSLDGVSRNKPFAACQGSGTQTGTKLPHLLGQKRSPPPPMDPNRWPKWLFGSSGHFGFGGCLESMLR